MTGRFWTLLVVLVASSTGFAGCIEAFDSLSSEGDGITAKADRDLADNAAAAWHPEAFLVGVVSVETMDARAQVPVDGSVGDGRAPFWYYAYASPGSDDTRVFRVTEDGQVTSEDNLPPMLRGLEFSPVAIQGWELDSDAALAAAVAVEDVAAVLAGTNLSVVEGLGSIPDLGTRWMVGAMSDAGYVLATVDARTGEVEVQDIDELQAEMPIQAAAFAPMAPPVVIHDEGTFEGSTREKTYEFEAGEGMLGKLSIWVDMPREYYHEHFEWHLVSPDGDTFAMGAMRGQDASDEFEFDIDEKGTYTLVIRHGTWFDFATGATRLGTIDFSFDLVAGYDLSGFETGSEAWS